MAKANPLIAAADKLANRTGPLESRLGKEKWQQFLELIDWLNANGGKRPPDREIAKLASDQLGVPISYSAVYSWRCKRAKPST